MKKIPFKTPMDKGEIGFMEICPKGDYHEFIKARKRMHYNDRCVISNKPLDADNGFYLCIWTHSNMPNCFVNKVEVEEMGFQSAAESVVNSWKLAQPWLS